MITKRSRGFFVIERRDLIRRCRREDRRLHCLQDVKRVRAGGAWEGVRDVGGGGLQGCRCNEERQWRPKPSLICR